MKIRQEYNYSHFKNVRVAGDIQETGNGIDLRAAVTTANPVIAAVGDDTNVSIAVEGKGTGGLSVVGDEANNAALNLWADQGDDNADKWSVTALAASQTLQIGNANSTSVVNVAEGSVTVLGAEAGNAALVLDADEGDDAADTWTIRSTASDNDLDILNDATVALNLTSGGNLEATGSVKSKHATAGIGYSTGAGGTVTQATSITTGVTLNRACGEIVTVSQTVAAGAEADFVVTNSAVAATDVVAVCIKTHTSAGTFVASVVTVAAGSFTVRLTNLHASAAGDNTLTLSFVVIKAVAA